MLCNATLFNAYFKKIWFRQLWIRKSQCQILALANRYVLKKVLPTLTHLLCKIYCVILHLFWRSCIESFISNEMEIDFRALCTIIVFHINETILQNNFGQHLHEKAKKVLVLEDLNLPVYSSSERCRGFIRHIEVYVPSQKTSSVNGYLCRNINSCSDEVRDKISLYNNVRQRCSALKVNNI